MQKILISKKTKMGPFYGEAGIICWLAKMFDFIIKDNRELLNQFRRENNLFLKIIMKK